MLLVLLLAILPLVVTAAPTLVWKPRPLNRFQGCGDQLADILKQACRGRGYNFSFIPTELSGQGGSRRHRRGIVEECCRSGCTWSTLELYCNAANTEPENLQIRKRIGSGNNWSTGQDDVISSENDTAVHVNHRDPPPHNINDTTTHIDGHRLQDDAAKTNSILDNDADIQRIVSTERLPGNRDTSGVSVGAVLNGPSEHRVSGSERSLELGIELGTTSREDASLVHRRSGVERKTNDVTVVSKVDKKSRENEIHRDVPARRRVGEDAERRHHRHDDDARRHRVRSGGSAAISRERHPASREWHNTSRERTVLRTTRTKSEVNGTDEFQVGTVSPYFQSRPMILPRASSSPESRVV